MEHSIPRRTPSALRGPLDGVRVVDLTRILAGPYCTMQLGDLGADVVKLEPPQGDDTRHWGPPFPGGESAYYLSPNRNKRGAQLDLRTPEGKEALLRLVRDADVVIENFKHGVMERWGLGYEDVLRALNPRLVYCSITGYGHVGPSAHLPGYDPVIEALCGLMSTTGEADGPPVKLGVALVDVVAGHQASIGILAALFERERSGEGQRVDISLFETALSMLSYQATSYLTSGSLPKRHGSAHRAIVPVDAFDTLDGRVMLCAGNDGQFRRLCELLGAPELADDPRFVTNPARVVHRHEITPILARLIAPFTSEELVGAAERVGVPIAPVNDLDAVFAHPQVEATEMLVTMEHPTVGTMREVACPIKLGRTPATVRSAPPTLGQHTYEVLAEAGFSTDEIDTLMAQVRPRRELQATG
jgi:crotonobetainyl-CoA:carnitine CoA-transferase CaiB-like acyl-CoA transferase